MLEGCGRSLEEFCLRSSGRTVLKRLVRVYYGVFCWPDRATYILAVLQRAEEVSVVADLHWEVHLDIMQGNEALFRNALRFETHDDLPSDVCPDFLR